ncbi:MAG: kynureninase [Hyphomicrobiales bacterium]
MMATREDCLVRDREDSFKSYRDRFVIPEGLIYLDGNSLGLMPKAAAEKVAHAVATEWGQDLITSWNKHGWFELPRKLGGRIARLLGAAPENVIVADTISVNLFKVLSAALALRRDRKVIVSDSGNFPSDLYVAQGLNRFLADGHTLKIVAPEEVLDAITEDVAVLMVNEVDYRTARKHDMKALIAKAHAKGALVIWDLAHSAGAIPVALEDAGCDFAIGCTYKYLNGGPGSQAFVFVHPRHQQAAEPALVGWWGHAQPFGFSLDWQPAPGLTRQQCGTQAILSMRALEAALDIWDGVDMQALHRKSQALCQLFIEQVEARCGAHGLKLAGPRNMAERGSHVSFHCPEGYAVMQALIARKVVGDFRAPDIIRFGFAPLYNSFTEVFDAAQHLAEVMQHRLWDRPEFLAKKAVT